MAMVMSITTKMKNITTKTKIITMKTKIIMTKTKIITMKTKIIMTKMSGYGNRNQPAQAKLTDLWAIGPVFGDYSLTNLNSVQLVKKHSSQNPISVHWEFLV